MSNSKPYYQTLPDGTLKHIHPIYGTEVWTVPDRSSRPFRKAFLAPQPIKLVEPENYCDFCQANYFKTPPEKTRLIKTDENEYQTIGPLMADQLHQTKALFRRVTNLFEIVPLNYWVKNHSYGLSTEQAQWKKEYLAHPEGLKHILEVIDTKLKLTGKNPEELSIMSNNEKLSFADAFFGGSHELIIGSHHFKPEAHFDNELVSSGALTIEEHFQYLLFTISTLKNIHINNPYIKYVMVFQNWLHAAGASVEHLHRQLVGMDVHGPALTQALETVHHDPNVYNESIVNFSIQENLVIAENNHAIALAELGHSFPTLAVYSKSKNLHPAEHLPAELSGISDLVHACHASAGNQTPCNEEWFYTPPNINDPIPWHILIKWRVNNSAGFEGGTKIHLNPMTPSDLKTQVIAQMKELRSQGKIANIKIDTECQTQMNPLLYSPQTRL